ncbi:MAG TPA: energy transducer TonB [Burkholderiales bacterium]|nr:energy transducer TonB [Burkholderiales bacterium]
MSDSTMITITLKEYERLKAAAGKLPIPDADTMPSDLVRLARPARERAADSTVSVRLSTAIDGRADSLRVRIESIIERGVVGGVRPRVDSIRERPAAADNAYWDFQVERPAQWIAGTGTPLYPDMLKAAGIQGTVLASFVVDTTGRAEVTTLRILRSSQELFSIAVRNALPQMRFNPALVTGGRKVKQVIQSEFGFSIQP